MTDVYLIAATELRIDGACDWLQETFDDNPSGRWSAIDEYVTRIENRVYSDESGGDILVELAGRRCYRSFAPGLNLNVNVVRKDEAKYVENILKSGHGSVLEHASGTFAVEKVTRVFTHELVRHRAGTAFSQESLRYVRLSEDLELRVPPVIRDNPMAEELFSEVEEEAKNTQKALADLFKIDEMSDFNEKKILTSAFRRLAPMGLMTGIIFTANVRALRWMLEQRSSPHAEEEMQEVFFKVGYICKRTWPLLLQDFELEDDRYWRPKYSKV